MQVCAFSAKQKASFHPIQDRLAQVDSGKTKGGSEAFVFRHICRLSARCNVFKLHAARGSARVASATERTAITRCWLRSLIQRNAKAQKMSAPIATGSGTSAAFSDERTARSVA
jgi:hypothetical protein